ncbi:MAG: cell division protein SepF [bacterium]
MAGAMRKMAVYLGLVEDENEYHEGYYDDEDDYDEPASSRRRTSDRGERSERDRYDRDQDRYDRDRSSREEPRSVTVVETGRSSGSVRMFRDEPSNVERIPASGTRGSSRDVPAPPAGGSPFIDLYRITTIHPHTYNDARRIGEEFREGVPVIMNLTEMDDGDAKRIVDFAAGLVFGLHGTIERITNKVFLLSPVNVDVAAEARAQLAQNGFFNQS